jgi:hypothetical protein
MYTHFAKGSLLSRLPETRPLLSKKRGSFWHLPCAQPFIFLLAKDPKVGAILEPSFCSEVHQNYPRGTAENVFFWGTISKRRFNIL